MVHFEGVKRLYRSPRAKLGCKTENDVENEDGDNCYRILRITDDQSERSSNGEEKNEDALARELARLGDVYVNDAFGAAHRAHASTAGVALQHKRNGWGKTEVYKLDRMMDKAEMQSMLDRLNADMLRSPAAPERILRNFQPATPSDRLTPARLVRYAVPKHIAMTVSRNNSGEHVFSLAVQRYLVRGLTLGAVKE